MPTDPASLTAAHGPSYSDRCADPACGCNSVTAAEMESREDMRVRRAAGQAEAEARIRKHAKIGWEDGATCVCCERGLPHLGNERLTWFTVESQTPEGA